MQAMTNLDPYIPLEQYQVDVRCFGLFIALQLYSQTAKMSLDTRQHLEQDPWGIKESSGYINNAVNSSPRSKATRVSYTQSEYQIMVAFIKSNLQLFLRIISSDIHNKEVSLSATEFNTLRILFKIQSPEGRPMDNMQRPKSANSNSKQGSKPLSTFTPFFNAALGGAQ